MTVLTDKELFDIAKSATDSAYAPYSGFRVGAALLCKNGNIYKGANIENASFSATVCAERTALFNAVVSGEKDFAAVAVAAIDKDSVCVSSPPCGVCRQVLSEFCEKDFKIVFGTDDSIFSVTLEDLLPHTFLLK